MSEQERNVIAPRIAIGLVLVSVFSAIAYFALSAYAPDFDEGSEVEAHALSKSAIGYEGLRVLMEASGIASNVDRGHGDVDGHPSLIVLTPPSESDDLKKLTATDDGTPRLVILPKWIPFADPAGIGRVLKGPVYDKDTVADVAKDLSKNSMIAHQPKPEVPALAADPHWSPVPGPLAKIDTLQTISGKDWLPLLSAPKGGAVLARLNGTAIYVLAEPDLVNTHGLKDLPTAALALQIMRKLRADDGPIIFDVTLNGLGREPSLLRELFAPPFLGATLCAIFTALLIGFHAAVRFGSPPPTAPVYARGKLALVSNAAEMIRLLKREPNMAWRYAQTTRNLVVRALGVRRHLGPQESDAVFKTLEQGSGTSYDRLRAEAGQVHGRVDLVQVARKIYEWRERILHAR